MSLDPALPASALAEVSQRPLGIYLHVPFCEVKCGYCDFNTYTATELGGGGSQREFAQTARQEIALARKTLGPHAPPAATVFIGGGTPTLLPVTDLALLVDAVRADFGLAPDVEVSTEANPDSVTPQALLALRQAGFTRVSVGMQSAVPHVLATLERTHNPANVPQAVQWAKAAGLHVSLDLIYGTPGESLADWRASVDAAIACEPDHISAYALVVEPGTALAARVRRGDLPLPDDDDLADKYELLDDLLQEAGLHAYEVSNWTRTPQARCRHNEGYWRGANWWGIGPGAHSHVGGVRWWNVKHPRTYADRLARGLSPAHGREILTPDQRHSEHVLLGVRIADGLPDTDLTATGRQAVPALIADGLLDGPAAIAGRIVLTRRGRLLADAVVRALLPDTAAAVTGR